MSDLLLFTFQYKLMPTHVNNQQLRQLSFFFFLVFLFIFLFLQMSAFLPAFLGAITFYMLSRRWMQHMVENRKWKKSLAAALILIISFLVVLVPIGLMVNILSGRIGYAVENSNKIVSAVTTFVQGIEQRFH
ncbi:MAG TPA: hypothetical protein VF540_01730, partial [Segetibacter sp.]